MNEQPLDIPPELLERPDLPKGLKDTDSYYTDYSMIVGTPLTLVPDLATGGERHRKWGFLLCARVVPHLDQINPGPLVFPPPSLQFIDAEDLETLKKRVIHEIDVAIDVAKKLKEYDDANTKKAESIELANKIAGTYGKVTNDDTYAETTTE